jgi:hypothetical protein
MKKQVTLLSLLALASGVTFGQAKATLQERALAPVKHAKVITEAKPSQHNQLKAAGDTVWISDFETASDWTASGPSTDYAANGWSIGTATNSWAGFQATMGTTGSFARLRNGDPNTAGTVVEDGPFILTYTGTFDLTDVPMPHLEWEQYGAKFVEEQSIQISLDGTNWVTVGGNADLDPLTNTGGAAYGRPMTRRFNMASALTGDLSQVRIRLYWDGALNGANTNYICYGWFVDNVRVVEGYEADLKMDQRFSSIGAIGYQYTKFAASQVNASAVATFGAKVSNNGSVSQNAVLNASTSGYTGSGAAVAIASGASDSVSIVVADGFTIPATAGTYNFNLSLTASGPLDNTGDDALTFPFEVTTNLMATDFFTGNANSMTGGFFGWASGTGDPSIGTWYEIFNNTGVDRIGVGIANITGAAQEDYIGNSVFAQLYYFNPATEAIEFLGITSERTIQATDFGKIVWLYFENRIPLTAGMDVAAMASCFQGSEVPIAFAGSSIAGTTIGMDGADFVSLIADDPGNVVRTPVVRLDFGNYIGFEENTINTSSVNLYPNPATNNATIAYSLNTESTVMIEVRDLAGKVVYSVNQGQLAAGDHQVALSTEAFASGVYTYTLSANGAQVTNKFVVKK